MMPHLPLCLARSFLLLILLGATACGGGDTLDVPTAGTLEVTTSTSGDPDPDGYRVTLDGADRGTLGVSAAVMLDGIAPGEHVLELGGVAAECQVQGGHSRTVTVTAGATATVAFAVNCQVTISAGHSIQAAVDANPAGTTFILKAGTHQNQTVIPKDGDSFIGEPGTVMDGGLVTKYAFRRITRSPLPSNVRIQGIKITRYTPARQEGAILAGGTADQQSTGWIVADCEISYNRDGAGIRTGTRMQILRNNIHHNGQIGILGLGDNILVEGNEIAYNNTQGYSGGNEAGGAKFLQTKDLVVRNNFSHHNAGQGLWTDYDNIRTLYEDNRVEDNTLSGIFHETSQAAVIRNNVVRRNGFGYDRRWVYGGGIQISASRDVEVYGNTVEENARGIVGIMQKRGSSLVYGLLSLENLYVHDNTVKMTVVATSDVGHGNVTGIGVDFTDVTYFTSRGNRFANNRYILGTAPKYFTWLNRERTEAEWQGYGQDVTGTFTR